MVKNTTAIRALFFSAILSATAGSISAQTAAEASYSALLQRIADTRLEIVQTEHFVGQQGGQIESLRSQLKEVPKTKAAIEPMLSKLADQLENTIKTDLPFLRDERLARVGKLKADLDDATLSVGDKYRAALKALKIEVEYGSGVDSYEGTRPLNAGEEAVMAIPLNAEGKPQLDKDGNAKPEEAELGTYLRYGRVALVYLDQRNVSARRFDTVENKWVDVKGSGLVDIRKAVRVSRGEVAPSVLVAPARMAP